MPSIELPNGGLLLFDDCDSLLAESHNWRRLQTDSEVSYARAWVDGRHLYFHREVMGNPSLFVDHHNLDGLDNRRANLRLATDSQNLGNQPKIRLSRPVTSSYKGVWWDRSRNKWASGITTGQNRRRSLGRHASEEDAARAYDRAALELWGEYARLNFPEEG